MAIILLALPSCRSVEAVTSDTHNLSLIAHSSHHDTVVLRDSIFVREVQRGDTIYLTRTEYRDRWRTHIVHDTILRTDSIVQVIEPPPERYIPPFYKRCTTILWIILAASIVYLIFRWRLRL
jgi:hypothetical protein